MKASTTTVACNSNEDPPSSYDDAANPPRLQDHGGRTTTQHSHTTSESDVQSFRDLVLIHKNVRGMTDDCRILEILSVLDGVRWDFVTVNETMRTYPEEHWSTKNGHLFMTSGNSQPTRGVAILAHKRWKHHIKKVPPDQRAHCICGRICSWVPHEACYNIFSS
eukprot:6125872-Pyramimonas_sp.AAC.1